MDINDNSDDFKIDDLDDSDELNISIKALAQAILNYNDMVNKVVSQTHDNIPDDGSEITNGTPGVSPPSDKSMNIAIATSLQKQLRESKLGSDTTSDKGDNNNTGLLSDDDKTSPDNSRTPTLVPSSGVLLNTNNDAGPLSEDNTLSNDTDTVIPEAEIQKYTYVGVKPNNSPNDDSVVSVFMIKRMLNNGTSGSDRDLSRDDLSSQNNIPAPEQSIYIQSLSSTDDDLDTTPTTLPTTSIVTVITPDKPPTNYDNVNDALLETFPNDTIFTFITARDHSVIVDLDNPDSLLSDSGEVENNNMEGDKVSLEDQLANIPLTTKYETIEEIFDSISHIPATNNTKPFTVLSDIQVIRDAQEYINLRHSDYKKNVGLWMDYDDMFTQEEISSQTSSGNYPTESGMFAKYQNALWTVAYGELLDASIDILSPQGQSNTEASENVNIPIADDTITPESGSNDDQSQIVSPIPYEPLLDASIDILSTSPTPVGISDESASDQKIPIDKQIEQNNIIKAIDMLDLPTNNGAAIQLEYGDKLAIVDIGSQDPTNPIPAVVIPDIHDIEPEIKRVESITTAINNLKENASKSGIQLTVRPITTPYTEVADNRRTPELGTSVGVRPLSGDGISSQDNSTITIDISSNGNATVANLPDGPSQTYDSIDNALTKDPDILKIAKSQNNLGSARPTVPTLDLSHITSTTPITPNNTDRPLDTNSSVNGTSAQSSTAASPPAATAASTSASTAASTSSRDEPQMNNSGNNPSPDKPQTSPLVSSSGVHANTVESDMKKDMVEYSGITDIKSNADYTKVATKNIEIIEGIDNDFSQLQKLFRQVHLNNNKQTQVIAKIERYSDSKYAPYGEQYHIDDILSSISQQTDDPYNNLVNIKKLKPQEITHLYNVLYKHVANFMSVMLYLFHGGKPTYTLNESIEYTDFDGTTKSIPIKYEYKDWLEKSSFMSYEEKSQFIKHNMVIFDYFTTNQKVIESDRNIFNKSYDQLLTILNVCDIIIKWLLSPESKKEYTRLINIHNTKTITTTTDYNTDKIIDSFVKQITSHQLTLQKNIDNLKKLYDYENKMYEGIQKYIKIYKDSSEYNTDIGYTRTPRITTRVAPPQPIPKNPLTLPTPGKKQTLKPLTPRKHK